MKVLANFGELRKRAEDVVPFMARSQKRSGGLMPVSESLESWFYLCLSLFFLRMLISASLSFSVVAFLGPRFAAHLRDVWGLSVLLLRTCNFPTCRFSKNPKEGGLGFPIIAPRPIPATQTNPGFGDRFYFSSLVQRGSYFRALWR